MSILLERMTDESGNHVEWAFWCPGCKCNHSYVTQRANPIDRGPVWQWNGNQEKPTFTPSLLVSRPFDGSDHRCHLFVRDGMIEYCSDCDHTLAGKTVAMVDYDSLV